MCAPDQRKQPCQLGCEEGFNQIGNDLYIECFCKGKSCQVGLEIPLHNHILTHIPYIIFEREAVHYNLYNISEIMPLRIIYGII